MSGKKTNKSKIRNTLIVTGVIAVAALAAYILLFMPMNNVPSWISNIRDAFYASAFYSDFENNFITDNRYTYLLKGLGVTFEVTFFAVLLGIVLGVIVALVRSSYDTLKEELRGFGKGILYFFYKLCGVYLTVIRGTPVVVQLMIIYFVIFASSNNKVMVAVLAWASSKQAVPWVSVM